MTEPTKNALVSAVSAVTPPPLPSRRTAPHGVAAPTAAASGEELSLAEQLAALKAENAKLAAERDSAQAAASARGHGPGVTFKASKEKGVCSAYGLGTRPITMYLQTLEKFVEGVRSENFSRLLTDDEALAAFAVRIGDSKDSVRGTKESAAEARACIQRILAKMAPQA